MIMNKNKITYVSILIVLVAVFAVWFFWFSSNQETEAMNESIILVKFSPNITEDVNVIANSYGCQIVGTEQHYDGLYYLIKIPSEKKSSEMIDLFRSDTRVANAMEKARVRIISP
jgi:hypothetical protein